MTAQIRLADVINFFEYEKVREDRRRRRDRAEGEAAGRGGPLPLVRLREPGDAPVPDPGDVPRGAHHRRRAGCRRRSTSTARCSPGRGSSRPRCSSRSPTRTRSSRCWTASWASTPAITCGWRWRAGSRVPGVFEAGHSDEEKGKLAAVHFVRFAFSDEAIQAFRSARGGPGDRSPRRARARPPVRRDQGRAADRPQPLTGARRGPGSTS